MFQFSPSIHGKRTNHKQELFSLRLHQNCTGLMKYVRDRTLDLLDTSDILDYIEGGLPNWIPQTIWEWLIQHYLAIDKFM